ncbi:LysR family transcriptional regulator [Altererythrobacter sp. SALINAS58]|uniref:helix-turn-helix domain-containing protein n=1 Tax=Alteripontixanthobacter muriae TaxID=2705546 RepID=UPI0015764E3B|nr:LysR family transcriptional regulator [Alteripontixanthobacter muriae]NTZ42880.1 LysR family transcriptional regulator [Alteripontixanthobacter muriae]
MKSKQCDPRLGWLEAFVATAQHLDFALAGEELGLNASRVRRNVEKLEEWLHKILIIDDVPLELYAVDGVQFLDAASGILKSAQSLQRHETIRGDRLPSAVSRVRLSELESFVSIAKLGNYKASAYDQQRSDAQIRRNLRQLERAFGCALVSGHSQIELTDFGREAFDVVSNMVSTLCSCVADISNYDPITPAKLRLRKLFLMRRSELLLVIARVERKERPTKKDKLKLKAAREQLAPLEEALHELRTEISSPVANFSVP